jgi:hypothetical protein
MPCLHIAAEEKRLAHVCKLVGSVRTGVVKHRPNPSIERTCHSGLRPLRPAAHVER